MNNKSFTNELRVRKRKYIKSGVRFAITAVVQSNYVGLYFIHKHKEKRNSADEGWQSRPWQLAI